MNQREAFLSNHPKTGQDDFRTPAYVLRGIEALTSSSITHDGACSEDNALAEPFNVFGEDPLPDDSLLFINPPWDTPNVEAFGKAASALMTSRNSCVFLLPNKLSEVRWVNEINSHFSRIIMLGGRIDFSGPHSVKAGASRWGCFLGILGHGECVFDSVTLRWMKGLPACLLAPTAPPR